jgi:hypothetical protein
MLEIRYFHISALNMLNRWVENIFDASTNFSMLHLYNRKRQKNSTSAPRKWCRCLKILIQFSTDLGFRKAIFDELLLRQPSTLLQGGQFHCTLTRYIKHVQHLQTENLTRPQSLLPSLQLDQFLHFACFLLILNTATFCAFLTAKTAKVFKRFP